MIICVGISEFIYAKIIMLPGT